MASSHQTGYQYPAVSRSSTRIPITLDAIWADLKAGFDDIMDGNTISQSRFMSLYTYANCF